jgi:membrane carboxypeptidase/penicillin-binding protein
MKTALGDCWDLDFTPPPGVTFRRIDPTTGQLVTGHCPEEEIAAFIEGTEPLEGCSEHRSWWTRDRGDDTDARDQRFLGFQRKRGLFARLKDALGV